MKRFLRSWLVLSIALVLGACGFSHVVIPYSPDRARPPDVRLTTQAIGFDYERRPIPVVLTTLDNLGTDKYNVRTLSFPSVGNNGQAQHRVDAWYFESKLSGKHKLIIVLPIWGSYVYPSWSIAKGLVDHYDGDAHVLYVLGENYLLDWSGMAEAATPADVDRAMQGAVDRFHTAVIDTRRLIDWVNQRPEVAATRIGLVGFSMSALIGSLVAVAEPRVRATALIMGGAHPHELMAVCDGRPGDVREAILPRLGWSVAQYEAELARIFAPVDVARYPGRVEPERILLVDAANDTCVPKDARDALWNVMGRPERISLFYDHKPAFLAMTPLALNWLRNAIYRFFDRAL